VLLKFSAEQKTVKLLWVAYLSLDERGLGISDSFQFVLFQWVLLKLSAVQKTVKLLWVAYLSWCKPRDPKARICDDNGFYMIR
jgi:hypothetical protein